MKKFYFLLITLFACLAANAATVYFENTANWSPLNAYAWSPQNANWPGQAITTAPVTVPVQGSSETKTLYYYDLPGEQTFIIFNNGSSQTKDLPATDGIVYSCANTSKIDPIGSIVNGTFVPAGEVVITYAKIYFPVVTFDYPSAYFYTWSPAVTASWPGDELTKETVDGTAYWVFSIDSREIAGATFGGIQLNVGSNEKEVNLNNISLADGDIIDINTGHAGHISTGYVPGGGGNDDPVDYITWYLNIPGDFNEWNPEGVPFSADGIATCSNLNIGTGSFKIKIWNGKEDIWLSNGEAITLGQTYVVDSNSDNNMTIADATADGVYSVTYNAVSKEMTITDDSISGIETIVTNDTEAPVEYFNLQGIRVAEPAAGLYIRRQGSVTAKVLVK